jgi:hypothetical protein
MADVNFQVKKGLTVPNGSASAPSVIFDSADTNTGIYSPGADQVAISTGGTARLTSSTTGITSALPVNVPLGTDSAPSVTFTGDLNTGIYSPGADQVAISTNGTGRLFINSAGNVGVGTASPTGLFDARGFSYLSGAQIRDSSHVAKGYVQGDARGFLLATDGATNVVFDVNGSERMRLDSSGRLGLGTSTPGDTLTVGSGSGYHGIQIFTGSANTGELRFSDTGGGTYQGAVAYNHSTNALQVLTNGSNVALTVDSSQRVGIGTTPQEVLDVNGRGRFQGSASSASSGAGLELAYVSGSTTGQLLTYNRSTSAYLGTNIIGNPLTFSIGGSEAARIDTSSRLLVGTSTAPTGVNSQYARQVIRGNSFDGASNARLALQFGSTASSLGVGGTVGDIYFTDGSGNDYALIAAARDTSGTSAGRLVFSTTRDAASSPTEAARINNLGAFKATTTGSVVTATSSSHEFTNANTGEEYALRITHGAATSNIYGMLIEFTGQTPNNTASHFGVYADTTNIKFGFRSDGGLANYSGNNVNLCDQREKKNIENLDSTWDCLKHWELKKFHYNEDSETDDLRYGVIAQQIAEHCPEVISEWVKQQAQLAQVDDDGNEIEPAKEKIVRLGVKEQQMMWMAIKALQEAQTRIETLEAEVAALKGQ